MPRFLLASFLASGLAPQAGVAQESPPGLLLVQGGATRVGSEVEDVERWIREDGPSYANLLAGETPQFTAEVADFLLMVTEVTTEQYAAYVGATGARPPYHWGAEAVEEARRTFLEEEARRHPRVEDRATWEPARWWDQSWTECDWEVPEDELSLPVVNVSQEEAREYTRWAGLRLPDEREFTRACRGDTARIFPWGKAWEPGRCNSVLVEPGGRMPVGSFPRGAVNGLFDLAGNVWEWTASPYVPFEGYRPITVTRGRAARAFEVEALAPFDRAERVVVGGSYRQAALGMRVATRRAKPPGDREEYLGFRCAASALPGLDAARRVIEEEILLDVLPSGLELDPARTAILQRWSAAPGSVGVDGYAVITGYERTLFCPVRRLPVSTRIELARRSTDDGPILLGFLSTSRPLVDPALEGGTYLVGWRGPGRIGEYDPLGSVPGFDPETSSFVFLDPAGLPLAARRAGGERFERVRESCRVKVVSGDRLSFSLAIPGERREGLLVELELQAR